MPRNPRIADVFYRRGLMEPTFEVAEPFANLTIRFNAPLSNSGGLSGGLSGANGTLNGTLRGGLNGIL